MMKEKELSFFKKLIISIKDFEKYPELASKNWGKIIVYAVKLLLIFCIIASCAFIYEFANELKSELQYIQTQIPNFTYKDGKIEADQEEPIIEQNRERTLDTFVFDVRQIQEADFKNYIELLGKTKNGIIFLQDKILIKTQVSEQVVEYNYNSIAESYKINNFNKEQMLQYFSGTNLVLIYIGIFITILIYMFLLSFISIWLDVILLGSLGFFTALILRLHLRFSAMCKIAVHSLTLPILLNALIVLIETFTTFRIKNFEIMYIGIAYIYIVAAILMIKADVIKNQKELAKILEEQAKVREELERKKEKEREEQEEQKKEKQREEQKKKEKKEQEDKNVEDEPQGENA